MVNVRDIRTRLDELVGVIVDYFVFQGSNRDTKSHCEGPVNNGDE